MNPWPYIRHYYHRLRGRIACRQCGEYVLPTHLYNHICTGCSRWAIDIITGLGGDVVWPVERTVWSQQ